MLQEVVARVRAAIQPIQDPDPMELEEPHRGDDDVDIRLSNARRSESDSSNSEESSEDSEESAEAARKRRRLSNNRIQSFRDVDRVAMQSEKDAKRKRTAAKTVSKRSFIPLHGRY
ncbi:MAG: hypothetical protein ACHQ1H_08635 [Nitrososphaerales archaeon]